MTRSLASTMKETNVAPSRTAWALYLLVLCLA